MKKSVAICRPIAKSAMYCLKFPLQIVEMTFCDAIQGKSFTATASWIQLHMYMYDASCHHASASWSWSAYEVSCHCIDMYCIYMYRIRNPSYKTRASPLLEYETSPHHTEYETLNMKQAVTSPPISGTLASGTLAYETSPHHTIASGTLEYETSCHLSSYIRNPCIRNPCI